MKTNVWKLATIFSAVLCLTFSGAALSSAKGPGSGGGGGGGGGGEIPDYGDLIILYRDANGVPIPSPAVSVTDPETGETVDGGLCWQPIAFNVNTEACPADCVVTSDPEGANVVDVNQFNCGVATGCSGCTQEADFGRMNDARAPDSVFESQLADVVVNLATADCITLDPAGRMVHSRVGDDDSVVSKTIDSPLQNLAIYRELMLNGTIGVALPATWDTLDTAARGLGAASDKTGELNLDMIAYLNQIMGLTDPGTSTILDPKLCEDYREEVQGNIELVTKCFLDYGNYDYDRGNNFWALPAPPYVGDKTDEVQSIFFSNADGGTFTLSIYGYVTDPIDFPADAGDVEAALEGIIPDVEVTGTGEDIDPWVITFVDPGGTDVPKIVASDDDLVAAEGVEVSTSIFTVTEGAAGEAGTFEYSYLIPSSDPPTWGIEYGFITTAVFDDEPGFTDGNIGGFAQAADDTRAVIDFMHTHPVSLDYVSPVACYVCPPPSGQDPPTGAYDVSISEESGLQVPRQMVDGSEGREFVVTVANASGSADAASGTVTVTATPENGGSIEGSPWEFEFTDLAVGASSSWTTFFTIDLGERTTIDWTATADAEFDVNVANNTVTATTGVKVTGGGGGGRKP